MCGQVREHARPAAKAVVTDLREAIRGVTHRQLLDEQRIGIAGDLMTPRDITDDRVRECTIGREIVIRVGRHGTSFIGARCLGAGTMLQAQAARNHAPFCGEHGTVSSNSGHGLMA